MPLKKDSTRRWVEMEFELPGTPEDVWQAIATGPGISSWFVPTQVEERPGGAISFDVLPGVRTTGSVTAFEPPRRFAYEERDWMPEAPPLATECIVESKSGDTCVVRLVHSLFATGEDWDAQLDSFEAGWPPFFRALRLYLMHFTGQPCGSFRVVAELAGTEAEVWNRLLRQLGVERLEMGQIARSDARAPSFSGLVEHTGREKGAAEAMLRLETPAPGIALFGAHSWGGKVHASVNIYLFGDSAKAIAARAEPNWQRWAESLQ